MSFDAGAENDGGLTVMLTGSFNNNITCQRNTILTTSDVKRNLKVHAFNHN